MNESLKRLLASMPMMGDRRGVAVDVGAHKGLVTTELFSSGYFSNVVAFEANPKTYRLMNETLLSANLSPILVNCAVGDRVGFATFFSDEDEATASLLPYASGYSTKGSVKTFEVPLTTLDEYFRTSTDPIRFLKIDTQGNDIAVLRGAKELFARNRPIVQTECIFVQMYENQTSPAELHEEFALLSYRFHSVSDVHIDEFGRMAFCDVLFVPDEMRFAPSSSFTRIDDDESYQLQISQLQSVCAERLELIERLHRMLNAGT